MAAAPRTSPASTTCLLFRQRTTNPTTLPSARCAGRRHPKRPKPDPWHTLLRASGLAADRPGADRRWPSSRPSNASSIDHAPDRRIRRLATYLGQPTWTSALNSRSVLWVSVLDLIPWRRHAIGNAPLRRMALDMEQDQVSALRLWLYQCGRLLAAMVGAFALGLIVGEARAQPGNHDDGHAERHDWYRDLSQPGAGFSCCNGTASGVEGDCRPTARGEFHLTQHIGDRRADPHQPDGCEPGRCARRAHERAA